MVLSRDSCPIPFNHLDTPLNHGEDCNPVQDLDSMLSVALARLLAQVCFLVISLNRVLSRLLSADLSDEHLISSLLPLVLDKFLGRSRLRHGLCNSNKIISNSFIKCTRPSNNRRLNSHNMISNNSMPSRRTSSGSTKIRRNKPKFRASKPLNLPTSLRSTRSHLKLRLNKI
jgi:hypothetical protein